MILQNEVNFHENPIQLFYRASATDPVFRLLPEEGDELRDVFKTFHKSTGVKQLWVKNFRVAPLLAGCKKVEVITDEEKIEEIQKKMSGIYFLVQLSMLCYCFLLLYLSCSCASRMQFVLFLINIKLDFRVTSVTFTQVNAPASWTSKTSSTRRVTTQ